MKSKFGLLKRDTVLILHREPRLSAAPITGLYNQKPLFLALAKSVL